MGRDVKIVAHMVLAGPHYCTPFTDATWALQVAKLHRGVARPLVYLDDALAAIRTAETAAALGGFEAGILSHSLSSDDL